LRRRRLESRTLRLYSQRVLYTKHSYHDRLRAVSTTPPWARPRASAELRRSTKPCRRQPLYNLTHTRTDALIPTNITNTPVTRLRTGGSTQCATPPADELCTARLYAWHASAIWYVALPGGCHGHSGSGGACWLPGAICYSRPASTRPTSFASYGGRTDEGRRPCCSTVTHCCFRPHVGQHASSPNDSSSNAATSHEHSDQQSCDAAATAGHEPWGPKTVSNSANASTTSTTPTVA
jgi:hypothetical protein